MEDYRNRKVVRLNIVNYKSGQSWKEELGDDGGSAAIILGIIVGIYFIMTTGMARIMFIDESLSAPS